MNKNIEFKKITQKDLYGELLPIFSYICEIYDKGNVIIAIDGGSGSGKTTLAKMLKNEYDCNVIHMDDFFLRPEQRTSARLEEIGGNIDRERFEAEVLTSLRKNETVRYRPFDCSTQMLGDTVTVEPKSITVVEGVYSMHPAFSHYYDFAIFLDIDPAYQRERILIRNSPTMAERFFDEWIPLENRYFEGTRVKERADYIFSITKSTDA